MERSSVQAGVVRKAVHSVVHHLLQYGIEKGRRSCQANRPLPCWSRLGARWFHQQSGVEGSVAGRGGATLAIA